MSAPKFKLQFPITDLLILMVLAAVAVSWLLDRQGLIERIEILEKQRNVLMLTPRSVTRATQEEPLLTPESH